MLSPRPPAARLPAAPQQPPGSQGRSPAAPPPARRAHAPLLPAPPPTWLAPLGLDTAARSTTRRERAQGALCSPPAGSKTTAAPAATSGNRLTTEARSR